MSVLADGFLSKGCQVVRNGYTHLIKCFALEAIGESCAKSNSSLACDTDRNEHALVVEVVHDVLHALIFTTDQVLAWYSHIVKFDERGAGDYLSGNFQAPPCYPRLVLERHHQQGDSFCSRVLSACADRHR